MTFMESVTTCFSNFATFRGRASRSEYWWFFLLNFVLGLIPSINTVCCLVLLVPSLAVGCRRLHDRGKTGWWQAFPYGMIMITLLLGVSFAHAQGLAWGLVIVGGALTLVSWLWLIVQMALPGNAGINQYGADPLNPMLCPSCGAPCSESDSFCPRCGGTLEHASWQPSPGRCPQCGFSCPENASFCPRCGAAMHRPNRY